MNVRRWLQTLWWMETRCCNTVFCLTVLHDEAIASKWRFFQEACKLYQYAKSQTQYVDRSYIRNAGSYIRKVQEAEADWDCQAAKQAHIVLFEATQDRSFYKWICKDFAAETTHTRLEFMGRMDEELVFFSLICGFTAAKISFQARAPELISEFWT